MTDYLEEHLGNAEALLERIRQLEQSESVLSDKSALKENVDKSDEISKKAENKREKSNIVSDKENMVYNMGADVNQLEEMVDSMGLDLEIRKKEQDMAVNRQIRSGDNRQTPEQVGAASKTKETGARANEERAENRPPLSDQLEELDRAVSAWTTLTPTEQESARDGYPISLSPPQGFTAGPNVTGTPAVADFASGGAPGWAEQADRMFRRDSRRYDGGFYLY